MQLMNSKNSDIELEELLDTMTAHGLPIVGIPPRIQIPNAKQEIIAVASKLLSCAGKTFTWREDYTPIADWLEDNQNKGLFVYGQPGLGKTLLCRYVIPAILLIKTKKIIRPVDATSLGADLDRLLGRTYLMIDDVGSELGDSVKYGERRSPFSEIMDNAEKRGTLLVITSNLDGTKLEERYGSRTLDRVKAMCKRVMITGKSMRG